MKKICFLSGYFNNFSLNSKSQGGAEYQNYLLKNELEKEGFLIYFISIGDCNKIIRDGKTIIIYLKKKKFWRKFGDFYFLYFFQLHSIIYKIKPKIIYQRGSLSWTGFASLISKRIDSRFIWAIASDEDVKKFQFEKISNLLFNFIDNKIAAIGKRKADTIIAQTQSQSDQLFKNFDRKANIVIPNYHPIPKENCIKKGGAFNVVWVANFSENKQPMKFVEVAKEIGKKRLPIQFIMIGRPYDNNYQHKIMKEFNTTENFQYLGALKQEEVNKVLSESHILINTSNYEGFSNVFIQAWMRSLVVVSLNANPDDVLSKHKIGFCTNGRLDLMIETILELFNDREKWNELSSFSLNYGLENHSIEKQINTIIPFFE
jgi:glycosyltransferase involved in cell wall biosynthesis